MQDITLVQLGRGAKAHAVNPYWGNGQNLVCGSARINGRAQTRRNVAAAEVTCTKCAKNLASEGWHADQVHFAEVLNQS
jgi:hypothetical protein